METSVVNRDIAPGIPTSGIAREVVPIVEAVRELVNSASPRVREVACAGDPPKLKHALWKLFRYSKDGEYAAGIGVFPTHAVVYFNRGIELDDPGGLLEGGGKVMRFTRLREPSDAKKPAVKRLVKQAFALAGDGGPR